MKTVNLFDRSNHPNMACMYPQANMTMVEGLTRQDLINLGYKEVCRTAAFGYRAAWKDVVFMCTKGKHKGMLYTLTHHGRNNCHGYRVYWAFPETDEE